MTDFRKAFPITDSNIYLNTANHGPPSIPVKTAIQGFLTDWDNLSRNGDKKIELANETFSKLVKAKPGEIACQPNTSRGLAVVAASINFKKGDNVVTNGLENWANVYPWTLQRRKGAEVRIAEDRDGAIDLNAVEKLVDNSTKAVSISHVQWLTGARCDLKPLADLCHDHGAYLVVDGIQAAGALDVDVKRSDVDFYACGSYKWLLGPSGAGFLYAKAEHLPDLNPPEIGYRAIKENSMEEPLLKESAQKLEFGEPSYLSFVGVNASISHILKLGTKKVEAQTLKLSQRLYDGLAKLDVELVSPDDKKLRSGVVSFSTNDSPKHYEELKKAGFTISLRTVGIRVSTGFFNTEEEVDSLLSHLGSMLN
jgi:cysteine desulfurase/selenocysteine lyase